MLTLLTLLLQLMFSSLFPLYNSKVQKRQKSRGSEAGVWKAKKMVSDDR